MFVRYAAAIFVAFVVSYMVLFLAILVGNATLSDLPEWTGTIGLFITCIAVSFCGVFSGALCLNRSSRGFGSIFLLLLGLGYDIFMTNHMRVVTSAFPYIWILPLTIGGATAVLFFFRRQLSNQIG